MNVRYFFKGRTTNYFKNIHYLVRAKSQNNHLYYDKPLNAAPPGAFSSLSFIHLRINLTIIV